MSDSRNDEGLDIAGFGKIAKAIPPKVYEVSATTLLTTFQQLTAPITETTSGLGRYLQQKFDNMVDAEKAIATYTVAKAIAKARKRLEAEGSPLFAPPSSKSFVRSIEEASKETDPLLHEMWTNLIAGQLTSGACHPHFVERLSHFSPAEARLLTEVLPYAEVRESGVGYISIGELGFDYWVPLAEGEPQPWSLSCNILIDFAFIDGLIPQVDTVPKAIILYRTKLGSAFLAAVSLAEDGEVDVVD
jgi:hypothetical protein